MGDDSDYRIARPPVEREPQVGDLLVATPSVNQLPWSRGIVLLLSHDEDGSLGVMLNRRTRLDPDDFPDWIDDADDHLSGGPVSPDTLIGLCRADAPLPGDEVFGGVKMVDLETLDNEVEAGERVGMKSPWRLFSGYCGWASGQLAAEIERGDWQLLVGPLPQILEVDPELLWQSLMRRQAMPLRLWATQPEVSELN